MKDKKGFTLLELLVVVLIIGILAGISLPQYRKSVEKAKAAEALINLKYMRERMQEFELANGIGTYSAWYSMFPLTNEKLGIELPSDWNCHIDNSEKCCSDNWCYDNFLDDWCTICAGAALPLAYRVKNAKEADLASGVFEALYLIQYNDDGKLYCCDSDEYCQIVAKEKTSNGCWLM